VWLQVDPDFLSDSHYILVEGALDEAAQWCRDTGCGQRMAYDLWKFKNEKELAVFLLKWS
jgi:hypothetical protein